MKRGLLPAAALTLITGAAAAQPRDDQPRNDQRPDDQRRFDQPREGRGRHAIILYGRADFAGRPAS